MNALRIIVLACLAVPVFCYCDLDCDGYVGPDDLAILLGNWNQVGFDLADLDGDGIIGAGDLAALLSNWGPCQND